jgi:hypothetical protein
MYARLYLNQISFAALTALSILSFSIGSILEPPGYTFGRFAVRAFRRFFFFHWFHLGKMKLTVFIKVSPTLPFHPRNYRCSGHHSGFRDGG